MIFIKKGGFARLADRLNHVNSEFFTNIGSIENRKLSVFVTDSERFFCFLQAIFRLHRTRLFAVTS